MFGAVVDPNLPPGQVRVTLIATGLDARNHPAHDFTAPRMWWRPEHSLHGQRCCGNFRADGDRNVPRKRGRPAGDVYVY